MTDQEIIEKAVIEIMKFQEEVNRKAAEREAKAARFRTLVNEVKKRTGCENITAERYVDEIMNPKPQPTDGERIG